MRVRLVLDQRKALEEPDSDGSYCMLRFGKMVFDS